MRRVALASDAMPRRCTAANFPPLHLARRPAPGRHGGGGRSHAAGPRFQMRACRSRAELSVPPPAGAASAWTREGDAGGPLPPFDHHGRPPRSRPSRLPHGRARLAGYCRAARHSGAAVLTTKSAGNPHEIPKRRAARMPKMRHHGRGPPLPSAPVRRPTHRRCSHPRCRMQTRTSHAPAVTRLGDAGIPIGSDGAIIGSVDIAQPRPRPA